MTTALPTIPAVHPARARDPFLDNAGYWVMLLVVMGHFMTPRWDIGADLSTYMWLYTFYLPVFILISGYTARRYIADRSGSPCGGRSGSRCPCPSWAGWRR